MRRLLVALLLFQSVGAFGQTVGAEIDFWSAAIQEYRIVSASTGHRDGKGSNRRCNRVADARRVGDRISVVRLDATGHFSGQVQTIPVPSDSLDVIAPSIAAAPRGDGFTLAWLETSASIPSVTRAAYCRLDRDLKPSASAVLVIVPSAATGPAIVRSGKTTWISAGASAWELRDDGSLSAPLDAGMAATDMTVATDYPQIVSFGHVAGTLTCPPNCQTAGHFNPCPCALVRRISYSLQFTSLYSVSASKTFDFDSDAAPAIGSNGRDVALVWLNGAHTSGGNVVMSRLLPPSFMDFAPAVNLRRAIGSFGAEGGLTRPDIASDGERYVVVWRTAMPDGSHNVVGASIDRAGNIIPLSIATSAADERDPSVISMGDGTFLVTTKNSATANAASPGGSSSSILGRAPCGDRSASQRRRFAPVVGFALEEAGGAEERALGEVRRHDLQRQRQLARVENPDGTAMAGMPTRFAGAVKMSREVHRQRIVRLRADRERRLGRRRRQQVVEAARTRRRNRRAVCARTRLRAAVVGVVIAGRQRERAEHDAALHFVAETFAARFEVDLVERLRARRCDARNESRRTATGSRSPRHSRRCSRWRSRSRSTAR